MSATLPQLLVTQVLVGLDDFFRIFSMFASATTPTYLKFNLYKQSVFIQ